MSKQKTTWKAFLVIIVAALTMVVARIFPNDAYVKVELRDENGDVVKGERRQEFAVGLVRIDGLTYEALQIAQAPNTVFDGWFPEGSYRLIIRQKSEFGAAVCEVLVSIPRAQIPLHKTVEVIAFFRKDKRGCDYIGPVDDGQRSYAAREEPTSRLFNRWL